MSFAAIGRRRFGCGCWFKFGKSTSISSSVSSSSSSSSSVLNEGRLNLPGELRLAPQPAPPPLPLLTNPACPGLLAGVLPPVEVPGIT